MKWRGGQAHEYSKTEIKPTEIGKFKGKEKVDLVKINKIKKEKKFDKDAIIEKLEASGNDRTRNKL
jgi:hypothetical protein